MNKKGIIFDLDGTTLNTAPDLCASVNYAFNKHGLDEISVDDIINNVGNGTRKLIERLVNQRVSKEEENKIYEDFNDYYYEHPFDYAKPYDGVIDTLKELKSKNYKLCLLSNKDDELVQEIVEHFFPNLFDFAIGAQYGIALKPDPTLTYLCMTEVGLETDDMLFVGDSLVDYDTAQNIRMTSIILTSGYGKKDALEKRGIPIMIDKFKDLLLFL